MTVPSLTDSEILPLLNQRVAGLEETGIVQVALHGWGREGLIPFWFGEGDVPTPEFICRAAADAMMAGETFYTDQRGILELRETIAAYMNRTFGVALGEDRVSLTTSGMAGLDLVMTLLLSPGDEVLVLGPVWPNIYSTVHLHGGTVRHASLELTDEGWSLDVQKLIDAIGPRTKAVFVNSPSNPTGWLMEREDQARLLEVARENGVWIVADEVYHQLVFDRDVAPSFLQIAEPDDRLVVVNSFSKSWLMTGWRLGWVTHPPAFGRQLAKIVQITTSGAPQFLQRAAIAAMRDGDPVIADLKARCRSARDLVFDRLEAWPRVRAVRPKSAFYAFFKVDNVDNTVDYCKNIIDEVNVGLAPGSAFGPAGEGCLRLCFAAQEKTLAAGMDRLARVLGEGSTQG